MWLRPLVLLLLLAPAADAQRAGRDPIARLEAARDKSPGSVSALRALGIAYYKANRFEEARTVLEGARQRDATDGVSALYTGLAAEAMGDLTAARRAYTTYLEVGKTAKVKDDIQARLVVLARNEAVASAKAAVANEAALTGTTGSPLVVAVPPLVFSGSDSSLKPLERGVAELLITDLSRSAQLTVVERDRMQSIADEIRLAERGSVDSSTAVRAGRLIQAGTLVSGVIVQEGSDRLSLDARLVAVADGTLGTPSTVTDALDALFTMQKTLVFQLFDQLGVTLTPAERQAIERRPTSNLNAFLQYSRGLQATDDGRFEDAARFFNDARSLDPGFSIAAVRAQSTQAAAQAAVQSVEAAAVAIESNLKTTTEGAAVTAATTGNPTAGSAGTSSGSNTPVSNTLNTAAQSVNPPAISVQTTTSAAAPPPPTTPQRDASTSTTGTDTPSRTGSVTIVIRRP
jgi:TolB-like protein